MFLVQETQQQIYVKNKYSTAALSDEMIVFYLRIQQQCCHQMHKRNNYVIREITLINIVTTLQSITLHLYCYVY